MEAIYQETEDLRRDGASEDAVIAHLEERLQAVSAKLDKECYQIRSARTSAASGSVPFANSTPLDLLKLLAGTLVFLALCGSLIFLVFPVGRVIDGDIGMSSITQLISALSLVALTSTVLYFLARKPQAERAALAGNLVAKQFAKRKLYFQVSSLGLVALAILGMAIAAKGFQVGEVSVLFALAFVVVGYRALGRTLWRCPACGYRLSFLHRGTDTQSIESCPACHVQLQ